MEKNAWKDAINPIEKAVKIAPDSSAGYLQRGIHSSCLTPNRPFKTRL
jgi:hypothetical protein